MAVVMTNFNAGETNDISGRSAQLAEVNTVSPSHINNTNTIQSVVISPIAGL